VCGGTKCGAGRPSSASGNYDFGIEAYLSSGMIHCRSTHPDAAAILLSSKLNLLQEGNQNYKQSLHYITYIHKVRFHIYYHVSNASVNA